MSDRSSTSDNRSSDSPSGSPKLTRARALEASASTLLGLSLGGFLAAGASAGAAPDAGVAFEAMPGLSINMSRSQAFRFLELLATDDKFRNQIQQGSPDTLANFGISLPPQVFAEIQKSGQKLLLPSKSEIRLALAGKGAINVPWQPTSSGSPAKIHTPKWILGVMVGIVIVIIIVVLI